MTGKKSDVVPVQLQSLAASSKPTVTWNLVVRMYPGTPTLYYKCKVYGFDSTDVPTQGIWHIRAYILVLYSMFSLISLFCIYWDRTSLD